MNWDWLHNFSSVFRDIAVGIGALFGGAGAFKILTDWRQERRKQQYRDKCMKKFAAHLRDPNETAIWKLQNSNKIYAVYMPNKTVQHIKPFSTFKELGYESGDWDEEVNKERLENYALHEPIDFS
jgi:hypothetical protein